MLTFARRRSFYASHLPQREVSVGTLELEPNYV